jgi:hypothetical protein
VSDNVKKSAGNARALEPAEEEQVANGVFVVRVEQPDGSVTTDVTPQGNVKVTEIETILGLALNGWRAKVGLRA